MPDLDYSFRILFSYYRAVKSSNVVSHIFYSMKGKVTITAKSGVKLEIPDNAVIANKVKTQINLHHHMLQIMLIFVAVLYVLIVLFCAGYQWS